MQLKHPGLLVESEIMSGVGSLQLRLTALWEKKYLAFKASIKLYFILWSNFLFLYLFLLP